MTTLQIIWFALIGVLLLGYTILDGYDLGSGFWYLFTKKPEHKKAIISMVGPFWDGNEVWLLTGGGAIFAAFPHVYATVFSGFYLALMLVLLALIFRAVGIEYKYQTDDPKASAWWDIAFGVGSTLPALLFGVALGNVLTGIPLDDTMTFQGNFFTLLNPYSLLFGLTGLAMFITHGALYIRLKTDGEQSEIAKNWAARSSIVFATLVAVLCLFTIASQPHLVGDGKLFPGLIIVIVVLAGIFVARSLSLKGENHKAFIFSSFVMAGLWLIVAIGLFPNLVVAQGNPDLNLTIYNASSSQLTLKTMLVIALIGMPFVLFYTWWVHRALGGKVKA